MYLRASIFNCNHFHIKQHLFQWRRHVRHEHLNDILKISQTYTIQNVLSRVINKDPTQKTLLTVNWNHKIVL